MGNKDLEAALKKSSEEAWEVAVPEDDTEWYMKSRQARLNGANEILWRLAKDAGVTLAQVVEIAATFIQHSIMKRTS